MPRDPRQPELLPAPSRTILDVVQEGLRGFTYRHRDRLARRKQVNEKKLKARAERKKRGAVQKPLHLEEEPTKMRILKVTYCAIFRQPINKLNPAGLKMKAECPVEVYPKSDRWLVRSLPGKVVYEKLTGVPSALQARAQVELCFETMVEEWQMWGTPPLSAWEVKEQKKPAPRMIDPGEVTILATGVVCWKEPEDFTHIMHTGPGFNVDGNAKTFQACCNEPLPPKYFISTKANVEPTCTTCAEVWKREYQGQ